MRVDVDQIPRWYMPRMVQTRFVRSGVPFRIVGVQVKVLATIVTLWW